MSAADWACLGLRPGAGVDAARSAFRKLALRHHPDKNRGDPSAEAKYLQVSQAYEAILRSESHIAEADQLLADPFADIFGAGWARSWAEGSVDPTAALEAARAGLAGDEDPLASLAAEMGVDVDASELSELLAASGLGGGADDTAPAESLPGNLFKQFFDGMPEGERERMLDLFERTFPAFLANEVAQSQYEAEDALFARAVQSGSLRTTASASTERDDALVARVEALNAEAVGLFGEGRFHAAAEVLSRAIACDPCNASLYGNRSLALERQGDRLEDALEDAERAMRCDATYVAAYERKARALLQLGRPSEAQAAARRGRMLDPEHTVLGELEDEAAAKAADAKLEIVRAGKRVVDAEAREACAPSLR